MPAERRRFYPVRHWRGELPLWASVVVNTLILLPLAIAGAVWLLMYLSVDFSPGARILQGYALFGALVILFVWQVVGVWRASARRRRRERPGAVRWFARVVALAAGLLLVWLWNLMSGGVAQLLEIATDSDAIGVAGYTLAADDETVTIRGAFAWSLVDAFALALADHPGATTVVLSSKGGNELVGRRIADEIIARGLDTRVADLCASACTVAFAAGTRRLMEPGARLGFHAFAPIFDGEATVLMRLTAARSRAYFARIGVPDAFMDRVEATPHEEIWFPDERELVDAHLLTGSDGAPD